MDGTLDWLSPNLPPPRNRHREPVSPPLAMMAHQRESAVRPGGVVSTASAPDEAQSQILLRVDSITKQYADQVVLADVAFDVLHGEMICLNGPTGAGKTN
jgi:ATPase subunit of ABC transporter with duplicated ATPase domains